MSADLDELGWEDGWWNREPAQVRRVVIQVIDDPRFPNFWARPYVGTNRLAVQVAQDGWTRIIDDQHGDGWAKVSHRLASGPGYGHRDHNPDCPILQLRDVEIEAET